MALNLLGEVRSRRQVGKAGDHQVVVTGSGLTGDTQAEEREALKIVEIEMSETQQSSASQGHFVSLRNGKASHNPFDALTSTFDDDDDPEQYLGVYDTLVEQIDDIEMNSICVRRLHERYVVTAFKGRSGEEKQDESAIMRELDEILVRNTGLQRTVKAEIERQKRANEEFGASEGREGSSVAQWRKNKLNTVSRRFKQACIGFQDELKKFDQMLYEEQARQIRTFQDKEHPLSEEKIEEIAQNPQLAASVIQNQIQANETNDALLEHLARLEERHEGMLRIQDGIMELHTLFQHLQILVEEQQELLDSIEANTEQTKGYVQSATKQLTIAEKHQKCSRKLMACMCCCAAVVLVVVVMIVFQKDLTGA